MVQSKRYIYFASDFHLGIPNHTESLKREKLLVQWLDDIMNKAEELYLMGDLFDFWFEYKTVVPKGYVRVLGKLAEMTDKGIPVYVFRGNHDIWAFDYLQQEVGAILYRKPMIKRLGNKLFYLAHGDGLGKGDKGYKLLKKVFECKLNQLMFRWLHPDIGTRIGLYFSHRSRIANIAREQKNNFEVDFSTEMLTGYSRKVLLQQPDIDYFVFGHRHYPVDYPLTDTVRLILLGDWVINFTYAVFDGEELRLKRFSPA